MKTIWRAWRFVLLAATLFAALGGSAQASPCSGSTPNIHEYVNGCPLFAPGSYVNTPLPATAPVDPNTPSMLSVFENQIGLNPDGSIIPQTPPEPGDRWDGIINISVENSTDSSKWSTVCSTEVLGGNSWSWMTDLHNAWMTFKVPIPTANPPGLDGGADGSWTLYDPATGQAWDFYQWKGAAPAGTRDPQGRLCNYEAVGGDYQPDVVNNPGYFSTQSLGSGVQEDSMWGRRASALPSDVGAITVEEWNNPLPDLGHTLQMEVPCANTSVAYWPATRHDGCNKDGSGIGGIPEGARIRVDPTYVCPHSTTVSAGWNQLANDRAYSLCVTLQKYGAVITDESGGGAAIMLANPTYYGYYGKAVWPWKSDGGNCCTTSTPVGTGTQWFNWYWDHELDGAVPHLQVIDPSYRPPYAPPQ